MRPRMVCHAYRACRGVPRSTLRARRLEGPLGHRGGPFWMRKDEGARSITKGEIEPGEQAADVARREFREELGAPAPDSELIPLGTVRQAGGKLVHAWAAAGDLDVDRV